MAPIGADDSTRGATARPRIGLPSIPLAHALGLAAAFAGIAFAGDDDGPELTRPTPPAAKPIISTPAAANRRAVLAMPGLTSAAARPLATGAGLAEAADLSSPSLDRPIETPAAPFAPRPAPAFGPGGGSITVNEPGSLEPDGLPDASSKGDRLPEPAAPGESRRLDPLPDAPRSTRPIPKPGPPPPARRGRLFGLGRAPAPPARGMAAEGSAAAAGPGFATAIDPRSDPAAESGLRRRIEAQARESVGDRAKDVEVRVVGKSALIQARGVKFYQKRGVRKSLEGLPAIAGMKTTIEVND